MSILDTLPVRTVLACLLALAVVLVLLQSSRLQAADAKLQAQEARLQALQAAVSAEAGATQLRARTKAQRARIAAEQSAAVAAAVASAPEWAAEPLPQEVRDAIPR